MSRTSRMWIFGVVLVAALAVGCWWVATRDPRGDRTALPAGASDTSAAQPKVEAASAASLPDGAATAQAAAEPAAAEASATPPRDSAARSASTQTHGFRATPEQRMADLAAYLAAENLVELRNAWQARAAQGDADAARSLQQMYDECTGVLFGQNALPRADRSNVNGWPGWQPPDAPARIAALEIGWQRCRGILPELEYKEALRAISRLNREALELANELRHPESYLGLPRDRADWHAWARPRMVALLVDGHADAAFAIGNSMAGIVARHSEIAWTLAACELGYPCSATTPSMRNWCVDFGQHCEGTSLIDYFRAQSTPRDWRRAQAERDEILRLLRAGDHEALMLPPGQIRGGGG